MKRYFCFKNECCTGKDTCYVFDNLKDALECCENEVYGRPMMRNQKNSDWNISLRKPNYFYIKKFTYFC